jgi:hypothetical protein
MTTTPATQPARVTTIPMPKIRHEGTFHATLNGIQKSKTRTGKACLRLAFCVPFSDGLVYRGGKATCTKTVSLPDPDQSGFSEAYQEAEAALAAFELPVDSPAMCKLFDSVDVPIDQQKDAWRSAFIACIGKSCTIEVERYDIADATTGDTITGFSVNRVKKAGKTRTLNSVDTEDAVSDLGTVESVPEGTRDTQVANDAFTS